MWEKMHYFPPPHIPSPRLFTPQGFIFVGAPSQGYKGELNLWLTSTILITKYGSTPQGYNLVDWWLDFRDNLYPFATTHGSAPQGYDFSKI